MSEHPQDRSTDSLYDAFLCHASEDKKAIVLPFAKLMRENGLKPWIDVGEVGWGDSLVKTIEEGLTRSHFVLVFISEQFLKKGWPEKEMRTAVSMEISGAKKVLPIVLGVEHRILLERYPFIADKAYKTIRPFNSDMVVEANELLDLLAALKKELGKSHALDASGEEDNLLERKSQRSPVRLVYREREWPFEVTKPDNSNIKVIRIGLQNVTGNILSNCYVRIEKIESENPSSLFNIFDKSKLALPAAQKQIISVGAEDIEYVPIAQLDRINFDLAGLGIELLCHSIEGHTHLDPGQNHTITVKVSAERGPPVEEKFRLWVGTSDNLRLERVA